jgi:hypothetical protein
VSEEPGTQGRRPFEIETHDTVIHPISAEIIAEAGDGHQSNKYQLLAVPVEGRRHEAGWLRDKAMTLRLADGKTSVSIALDAGELRRLRDAINDEIGPVIR